MGDTQRSQYVTWIADEQRMIGLQSVDILFCVYINKNNLAQRTFPRKYIQDVFSLRATFTNLLMTWRPLVVDNLCVYVELFHLSKYSVCCRAIPFIFLRWPPWLDACRYFIQVGYWHIGSYWMWQRRLFGFISHVTFRNVDTYCSEHARHFYFYISFSAGGNRSQLYQV